MKLREHPLMRYQGISKWPPVWTARSNTAGEHVNGEIGILKELDCDTIISKKCFLVIEHDQQEYVGTLLFDDGMFCWLMSVVLKKHIGKSIKEIGDLDLSYAT